MARYDQSIMTAEIKSRHETFDSRNSTFGGRELAYRFLVTVRRGCRLCGIDVN
jgi:hypothetical protein